MFNFIIFKRDPFVDVLFSRIDVKGLVSFEIDNASLHNLIHAE